jgi:hypothetical protein
VCDCVAQYREDTWQDEVRLKTSIIGLDQIDYAVQLYALPSRSICNCFRCPHECSRRPLKIIPVVQAESKLMLKNLAEQHGITA